MIVKSCIEPPICFQRMPYILFSILQPRYSLAIGYKYLLSSSSVLFIALSRGCWHKHSTLQHGVKKIGSHYWRSRLGRPEEKYPFTTNADSEQNWQGCDYREFLPGLKCVRNFVKCNQLLPVSNHAWGERMEAYLANFEENSIFSFMNDT